ncbi:MAG: hypothetical protein L0Z53_14585 [Acidobacteriales bacterium]|nr:hypothetical protein [Terriglobales bacterium]
MRTVALFSSLNVEQCQLVLRDSIDQQPSDTSPSGYAGSKPVVGVIEGHTFRIHRRKFWYHHFAINFYGELIPTSTGTRVHGHFDISESGKLVERIVLIAMTILGLPVFLLAVKELLSGGDFLRGNQWVVVVGIPVLLLLGFFNQKIGLWTNSTEQVFLLDFLRDKLAAKAHPTLSRLSPKVNITTY